MCLHCLFLASQAAAEPPDDGKQSLEFGHIMVFNGTYLMLRMNVRCQFFVAYFVLNNF